MGDGTLEITVNIVAAALCGALAPVVLVRDERGPAPLALFSALTLLAAALALAALSASAVEPERILLWKGLELVPRSLLPAASLVFALTYARADAAEHLRRWRPGVLLAVIVPLLFATALSRWFFDLPETAEGAFASLLPLGWAGVGFHLAVLVAAVAVLANLEATLRATRGSKRWRVKYLLIGVGAWQAAEIYLASQALLYSSVDLLLQPVRPLAALLAGVLAAVSLVRTRETTVEIRLSRGMVYSSLSVLLVGGYLIAVGLVAEILHRFDADTAALGVFAIFVLLVALAAVVLSDRLREQLRRFVSRNFYAPAYDYRKEWTDFTRRTASLVDPGELSTATARSLSETFGVDSVTIWRIEDPSGEVVFGGSTELSEAQVRAAEPTRRAAADLVALVRDRGESVDFGEAGDTESERLVEKHRGFFDSTRVRLALPLVAARRLVGVMTVGPRITRIDFSIEDRELLLTIADQAAATLLNLQLSDQVARAKEMEAFQTLSSFFVHDLKNLASMLSLTVQNLPRNFDNPEFRKDALEVIGESVEKMNAMCGRLSTLGRKLEIHRRPTDLNRLVEETLSRVNGSLRTPATSALRPLPELRVDAEQIEKVLTNLLLNASEAIEDGGSIRVATEAREGVVVVSVSDSGRGMSEEFVRTKLFRPFQTTKSKGLGIGLFQSRRLVEAHGGYIEVESAEGKGTTFRVHLPAAGP